MADSLDAGRAVRRAEAIVRCWALVLAVLAAATLPLVYLVDDPAEPGDAASLWNALPQVVFESGDDFGEGDMIAVAVTVARIALVALLVLLVAAVGVAVSWAKAPAVDEVPGWVRSGLGVALLVAVLALLLAAGQVPDTDVDGVHLGLDVGAGFWAPVVAAVLLLAPAEPWWRG
jgi:hypothetical protein